MIPLVGFLPADDPRVAGTVDAIHRELCEDGFVLRYRPRESLDGLADGEGAFLPCSFWLVDCLALLGRREEYDPRTRRQVGNFPQAFSHVGLVNSAANLSGRAGPMERRASRRHPRSRPARAG